MKMKIEIEYKVWWIKNPPSIAIYYPVKNPEEGLEVYARLVKEDLENPDIKSNVGGLIVSDNENRLNWTEWYDENGLDISQLYDEQESKKE